MFFPKTGSDSDSDGASVWTDHHVSKRSKVGGGSRQQAVVVHETRAEPPHAEPRAEPRAVGRGTTAPRHEVLRAMHRVTELAAEGMERGAAFGAREFDKVSIEDILEFVGAEKEGIDVDALRDHTKENYNDLMKRMTDSKVVTALRTSFEESDGARVRGAKRTLEAHAGSSEMLLPLIDPMSLTFVQHVAGASNLADSKFTSYGAARRPLVSSSTQLVALLQSTGAPLWVDLALRRGNAQAGYATPFSQALSTAKRHLSAGCAASRWNKLVPVMESQKLAPEAFKLQPWVKYEDRISARPSEDPVRVPAVRFGSRFEAQFGARDVGNVRNERSAPHNTAIDYLVATKDKVAADVGEQKALAASRAAHAAALETAEAYKPKLLEPDEAKEKTDAGTDVDGKEGKAKDKTDAGADAGKGKAGKGKKGKAKKTLKTESDEDAGSDGEDASDDDDDDAHEKQKGKKGRGKGKNKNRQSEPAKTLQTGEVNKILEAVELDADGIGSDKYRAAVLAAVMRARNREADRRALVNIAKDVVDEIAKDVTISDATVLAYTRTDPPESIALGLEANSAAAQLKAACSSWVSGGPRPCSTADLVRICRAANETLEVLRDQIYALLLVAVAYAVGADLGAHDAYLRLADEHRVALAEWKGRKSVYDAAKAVGAVERPNMDVMSLLDTTSVNGMSVQLMLEAGRCNAWRILSCMRSCVPDALDDAWRTVCEVVGVQRGSDILHEYNALLQLMDWAQNVIRGVERRAVAAAHAKNADPVVYWLYHALADMESEEDPDFNLIPPFSVDKRLGSQARDIIKYIKYIINK